mmetsp:Transcript_15398/g.42612  ORF Transcript_15398/g.42612 Transcript_15398/m.42612 type:complete len:96 (+) Transcript_15398:1537-1824(+)
MPWGEVVEAVEIALVGRPTLLGETTRLEEEMKWVVAAAGMAVWSKWAIAEEGGSAAQDTVEVVFMVVWVKEQGLISGQETPSNLAKVPRISTILV